MSTPTHDLLTRLIAGVDPVSLLRSIGIDPDPWQIEVARRPSRVVDGRPCPDRTCLLIARQGGKSTVAAAVALSSAIAHRDSSSVCVAPSERQSKQMIKYARRFCRGLGIKLQKDNATFLELPNGSIVTAFPGRPDTIRGESNVRALILDEAGYLGEDIWAAVQPMVPPDETGRVLMISTPNGKQGLFWKTWSESADPEEDPLGGWHKMKVPASSIPRRYPPHVLAALKADPLLGRLYAQEYECEFLDAVDSVFTSDVIERSLATGAAFQLPEVG